jgi:hypothetical protein
MSALTASKLTGALPAIDGSSLTGITTDTTTIENNIAMLAFFRASDNSKAKYSLVDQVVDEYVDATGIDAGNSTNEELTSGYYRGTVTGSTTSATGGTVSVIGSTTLHTFTSSGNFYAQNTGTAEILLVGGGGTGGIDRGGGGAGGGVYPNASQAITGGTTYAIVVGAGGVHPNGGGTNRSATPDSGWAGGTTTGFGRTAAGGNHGRANDSRTPYGNGTGHEGGHSSNNYAPGSYSGNAGGSGGNDSGGGGAGDGANGGNYESHTHGGHGGAGTQNNIDGNNYYYGGGGGGSGQHRDDSNDDGGDGGIGGGGGGVGGGGSTGGAGRNAGESKSLGSGGGGAGGANTGGGGGGAGSAGGAAGGTGGSGIVMVKYTTSAQYGTAAGDLTLQSVATTAESAPTTGDIVMLIEDTSGTATINTDVKAYISRDGSAFSSAVTLTDEGNWGTNKRILAAHDVDISGITSGTAMKYKITTHNQSAGSKETRIHATSLAWA